MLFAWTSNCDEISRRWRCRIRLSRCWAHRSAIRDKWVTLHFRTRVACLLYQNISALQHWYCQMKWIVHQVLALHRNSPTHRCTAEKKHGIELQFTVKILQKLWFWSSIARTVAFCILNFGIAHWPKPVGGKTLGDWRAVFHSDKPAVTYILLSFTAVVKWIQLRLVVNKQNVGFNSVAFTRQFSAFRIFLPLGRINQWNIASYACSVWMNVTSVSSPHF